jgi:hypothetical protein
MPLRRPEFPSAVAILPELAEPGRRRPPAADLGTGTIGNRCTGQLRRQAEEAPGRPSRPGSTVDERHTAPAGPCPPAWRVGRSPATRPRAVRLREPPEDAPARGDQHPARIGVQQGLQMQLLAEARRRPSVHPADLRPPLPGLPHPRPAVLQPRRPAVPGARHRAAGSGAGPAVAGEGDDEGRHRPRRSRPRRCRLAGSAAGGGWVGATPSPLPHGDGAVLPGPAGPSTRPRRPQHRQRAVAGRLGLPPCRSALPGSCPSGSGRPERCASCDEPCGAAAPSGGSSARAAFGGSYAAGAVVPGVVLAFLRTKGVKIHAHGH